MARSIILAAGEGKRLRPLTTHIPKCMVELFGKPLIEHQLLSLKKVGISDITIIGGYKANVIPNTLAKLKINENFRNTNMVFTLFENLSPLENGIDLLISYGDCIYEPRIIQSLLKSDAPLSVAIDLNWKELWELRFSNVLEDAETLRIDDNGMVYEIGNKPNTLEEIQGQYMGLIKIHRDWIMTIHQLWIEINAGALFNGRLKQEMHMTDFIQYVVNHSIKVKAVPVEGGWLELDSLNDLDVYQNSTKKLNYNFV